MPARKRSRWGNATLEFTLVGIPLIFVLISTFEMARGMWIYHTLAYAVKEGARYTIVRGQNSPNQVTLGGTATGLVTPICNYIVKQGPGLIAHQLSLTFTSSVAGAVGPYTADACPTAAVWPPGGADVIDNQPGQTITISATYPFQSTIILFWPGTKDTRGGFPTFTFPAQASEVMQF
jgi:Flp pilus assembly protein TadG